MIAVTLFALFIIAMSMWMLCNPESWVRLATEYCKKPFMHPCEIAICLGFGLSITFTSGVNLEYCCLK